MKWICGFDCSKVATVSLYTGRLVSYPHKATKTPPSVSEGSETLLEEEEEEEDEDEEEEEEEGKDGTDPVAAAVGRNVPEGSGSRIESAIAATRRQQQRQQQRQRQRQQQQQQKQQQRQCSFTVLLQTRILSSTLYD
ncbi:hypothetical protein M0802_011191 [Mischocyttarus mexicanus]|nr:hypothetical protein M0802_011191 [Mischocyttarus mexicanus]